MHEIADKKILERILEDNEELACHNREHFDQEGILAINFMSAPGAGKTTLIGELLKRLGPLTKSFVLEGDMVGEIDCLRLREQGIDAYQISTGRSCHLDASMVARALHENVIPKCDLLIIENVGNLVCPAEFPLGAHLAIVLLSVTEGDDKPLKYPIIFNDCDAIVLTKCDLLDYVDFDSARVEKTLSGVNPGAGIFSLSTRSGQGMDQFVQYIKQFLITRQN